MSINPELNCQKLIEAFDKIEYEVKTIEQIPINVDEAECFEESEGTLWEIWKAKGLFEKMTNFNQNQLEDIYQAMKPYLMKHQKRGPKPKTSPDDSLLIYMAYLKSNLDYESLGAFLGMNAHNIRECIKRTRPVLYDTLHSRWLEEKRRPEVLKDTPYPYASLIIDTTTIEVFHPRTSFQEAKIYWDGKNKYYGVKKEVAVMASSPHYALFFQPYEVASKHDYSIFKENYGHYLEYLLKLPDEYSKLPSDNANKYWGMLMDKGYIGNPLDTPGIRRIHPKKKPTLSIDLMDNKEINRLRVPIECWFGRLKKLWKILRDTYSIDHKNFDQDFDNCGMLTNEHIKCNLLSELDQQFEYQLTQSKIRKFKEKVSKRKLEMENYKKNKLMKLNILIHY